MDRTRGDDIPVGWRELVTWAFEDLSAVVGGERRFALRRLGARSGQLAVVLRPLRASSPSGGACDRAIQVVLAHVMLASRLTCSTCGAPGVIRPLGGTALCDAHAGAPPREAARVHAPSSPRDPGETRHRPDAPSREPGRVPLYELDDVAAALGAAPASPRRSDVFCGDPDELPWGEPQAAQAACLRRILESGEEARWRVLARPEVGQLAALQALARRAPQMAEALDTASRHLRAAMVMETHVALPPLLLLGDPGTGKTWFVERLGEALGLPVRRHPMNVSTVGDGLTGSHPVWRGARAGLVARTLLAERVANPIVLLDEADKAAAHDGVDPFRPLYSCLEPASSRRLCDEYLSFPVDASNVIWLLTANSIEALPEPIVDRLTVVEVPAMSDVHLRAVAASVFVEMNAERHGFFEDPADAVVDRLSATSPRRMRRILVDAMTRAAAAGRRVLRPDDVVAPRDARRRAGFGAWS